jgi:hypothetical protein
MPMTWMRIGSEPEIHWHEGDTHLIYGGDETTIVFTEDGDGRPKAIVTVTKVADALCRISLREEDDPADAGLTLLISKPPDAQSTTPSTGVLPTPVRTVSRE